MTRWRTGGARNLHRNFCSIAFALIGIYAHAQDPAQQQDAEAEREKILKASDQIDLIETNSESNKAALEALKADVAQLKLDQSALRQQLADTQAALAKAEQSRVQERKALLDEVAALVATSTAKHAGTHPAKSAPVSPVGELSSSSSYPATAAAATTSATTNSALAPSDSTPPAALAPKPQRGYYHIVEKDETLSRIVAAFREEGVHVTLAEVRRANALDETSTLYVGEKLFIPKPGP